ncbi:MAG: hypothetical protein ACREQK_01500 [Candidatus Binatia bacterium]
MPYGSLDVETLSAASQKALEKALERWQTSMQISKPDTFFLLASYDNGSGDEIQLQKNFLARRVAEDDLSNHIITVQAKDEQDLATKIARNKDLSPIQTLIVFAETRHAIGIRSIFRRKFRKALEIKTFKVDFERTHPWITTSTSFAWLSRNVILKLWFAVKARLGRRVRKLLKYLFSS